MLEQRVERLEEDVREIKTDLRSINGTLSDIRERLGKIDGRLDQMPNAATMWKMVVGTWIAGAGIVMVAFRIMQP